MSKVKFVLDRKGVVALLKSEEAKKLVKSYADNARSKLGDGYSSDVYTGRFRVNASVGAESIKAKRQNLKRNTLLKAVMGSKK